MDRPTPERKGRILSGSVTRDELHAAVAAVAIEEVDLQATLEELGLRRPHEAPLTLQDPGQRPSLPRGSRSAHRSPASYCRRPESSTTGLQIAFDEPARPIRRSEVTMIEGGGRAVGKSEPFSPFTSPLRDEVHCPRASSHHYGKWVSS